MPLSIVIVQLAASTDTLLMTKTSAEETLDDIERLSLLAIRSRRLADVLGPAPLRQRQRQTPLVRADSGADGVAL